jgi:hypothetical protein
MVHPYDPLLNGRECAESGSPRKIEGDGLLTEILIYAQANLIGSRPCDLRSTSRCSTLEPVKDSLRSTKFGLRLGRRILLHEGAVKHG